MSDLGEVKEVVITKDDTLLMKGESTFLPMNCNFVLHGFPGQGREEDIQRRVDQLKQDIEDTKSDYEREKLQDRVAKLCDGVALVKVCK